MREVECCGLGMGWCDLGMGIGNEGEEEVRMGSGNEGEEERECGDGEESEEEKGRETCVEDLVR